MRLVSMPFLLRSAAVGVPMSSAQSAESAPNLQGCMDRVAQMLPYCNASLALDQRLDDLMARMNLTEKIAQITPQGGDVDLCTTETRGKPEIGLPKWLWLVEATSNIASGCPAEGHCATAFVGPMGMGASFNRTSWRMKGSVLGTEMRAFANTHGSRFSPHAGAPIGLTAFGPNINIARDPRFGRNSELPGEDPFLSGTYGYEMVAGMQERDAHGYPKVAAFLKHFTAYSMETNRMHDNHNISLYDFYDTYLPQFERAARAQPAGVMCSYTAENAQPSCSNNWLLNTVLRSWLPDAMVTTDCLAVPNLRGAPVFAKDDTHAAAYALMNGTDLEMGSDLFKHLGDAVAQGLASEARVDQAVRRSFRVLFELGRFDPPEATEWSNIGYDDINSTNHQRIAYEAALQSMVLLRNDGALPLSQGIRLAVVGPQALSRAGLLDDYASDQVCFGGDDHCITSISDALEAVNTDGRTCAFQGVDVNSRDDANIPEAMNCARDSDVIVLALGIDKLIEHEGIDRSDIVLPGLQEFFARQVLALEKPTVLVLTNGGALAIDTLTARASPAPYAIVEAFNPSVSGSKALAASLFGLENCWGKLPVTIYPRSFIYEQAMTNYDMTSGVGRTYRYYKGEPLFSFGFGLSLTSFRMACQARAIEAFAFLCIVANIGDRDGDEVVQVYHQALDIGAVSHPLPKRSLVAFERVSVKAAAAVEVDLKFTAEDFMIVNAAGERTLYPGTHRLIFSRGHGDDQPFDVQFPSHHPREIVL